MTDQLCDCGQPLHYVLESDRLAVQGEVDKRGPTVPVGIPGLGAWRVPRHYIALHGIRGVDVPALAERYGWKRAEGFATQVPHHKEN